MKRRVIIKWIVVGASLILGGCGNAENSNDIHQTAVGTFSDVAVESSVESSATAEPQSTGVVSEQESVEAETKVSTEEDLQAEQETTDNQEAEEMLNTYTVPEGFDMIQEGVSYSEITEIEYPSQTTGTNRKANIILPVNYDEEKKYPVLYLLHGIGGDHNEWLYGEPATILGNLQAAGEAEEMIVVIPNVRARADDKGNPSDIFSLGHYEAFNNFINDLRDDLMPYIEQNYSVAIGRENTAIAGLSMGGRTSLYIGFSMPETFGYIGAFCPAPGIFAYTNYGVSEDGLFIKESFTIPEELDTFVMIVEGETDDIVKNWPKEYHEALEQNQVEHVYYVTEGGHDFTVWKHGLYNYIKNIF
ncbi:MAG: esterase family protein [Lachnospiraceae bacterium]|nr:esterase family protein [Lachnospiraceae bacterium]